MSDVYKSQFLTNLHELWQHEEFWDTTITVCDEQFFIHRVVLAAGSPYFKAMFTSRMMEREQAEIVIHDVAPATFQTIMEFVYTG